MSAYAIPVSIFPGFLVSSAMWSGPTCIQSWMLYEQPRVNYQTQVAPDYSGQEPYEQMRAASVLALVEVFDIPLSRVAINVSLPRNNRKKAPIVVYRDAGKTEPLLVLECNRASINNRQHHESFVRALHKARVLGAEWALCAVGTKRVLVARASDPASAIELPFGLLKGIIN